MFSRYNTAIQHFVREKRKIFTMLYSSKMEDKQKRLQLSYTWDSWPPTSPSYLIIPPAPSNAKKHVLSHKNSWVKERDINLLSLKRQLYIFDYIIVPLPQKTLVSNYMSSIKMRPSMHLHNCLNREAYYIK